MHLKTQSIKQALSNAYKREAIPAEAYTNFNDALSQYLEEIRKAEKNKENEENLKEHLKDFLVKGLYGKDYPVNSKSLEGNFGIDLAIFTGEKDDESVDVLLEVKKPGNTGEMITPDELNRKALHEAVLYYLQEKDSEENDELKHIVITNCYRWFIFDAREFYRFFYTDKSLLNQFRKWKEGKLDSTTTKIMYDKIENAVKQKEGELRATHFDLPSYTAYLQEDSEEAQLALSTLLKVLSPRHLLKKAPGSDSNNLDNNFYQELLYILGLEEYKKGGAKYIDRAQDPQQGSIIENTINALESEGVTDKTSFATYGEDYKERLFNISLELTITWLNRILFLKLLESQLVNYHQGDDSFRFMSPIKIGGFNHFRTLFFNVLAVKEEDRDEDLQEVQRGIPYLNSSLFEPTDLEKDTIRISSLQDYFTIQPYHKSVLRKSSNKELAKKVKEKEPLPALQYFMTFLNAYDFGSVGQKAVQEESKPLISASVLGLVFEKINGYKEGSFFTPGFITTYMAKETLRKTVLSKFHEHHDIEAEGIKQLSNDIRYYRISPERANEVIDSMKICDPAVGSGHFLVSVLNELIAVKSDLGILMDADGKLISEYQVKVGNDELEIEDQKGNLFDYTVDWDPQKRVRNVNRNTQQIQKALFNEKRKLIEQCIFGVDINPNSVKICRLRLWTELLKNAYYREEENFQYLETLPNIDINIKEGNSLISRFALDMDLQSIMKKVNRNRKKPISLKDYQLAVEAYKKTSERDEKDKLQQYIQDVKDNFREELKGQSPINKKLSKVRGDLELMENPSLFGEKQYTEEEIENQRQELEKLKKNKEDFENNAIYEDAFEWRFEFPDILNEDGQFEGFDVAIGNPPYIRHEDIKELKAYLKNKYNVFASTADILTYFIELSINVLKREGTLTFIISNKFMRAGYGKNLRQWLQQYQLNQIIDFGDLPVFEEATTYPCIISLCKGKPEAYFIGANVKALNFDSMGRYLASIQFYSDQQKLPDDGWTLIDAKSQSLIQRLKEKGERLETYVDEKLYYGIKTGLNEGFVISNETKEQMLNDNPNCEEFLKPYIAGKDIKPYRKPDPNKWLILFKHGRTKKEFGDLDEIKAFKRLKDNYPSLTRHLELFREKAKARADQGEYWWELRQCDYYDKFEKPKIVFPNLQRGNKFTFDDSQAYVNAPAVILPAEEKFLLALFNSKVVWFFLKNTCAERRGGYIEVKPQYFEQVPIPYISEKSIVELENKIERINLFKAKGEDYKALTEEKEIDQKVYELFELDDREVQLIEEALASEIPA